MSLADERVLELQSQTDLLERLQLLTRFGSNFIAVSGVAGAGKTWIAQRYLEAWADDKNQSLLMCYPGQDDFQWRSTILAQVYSHAEFNPDESLVSNLSAILEGEECNIVIVVDDAHILSEVLISELWSLVAEAQKKNHWTINVVLFSLPRALDKQLSRLSDGEEHKPVDLEIDMLTPDDADRFFEFLVIRYVDEKMEPRVRRLYSQVKKIPGEIMALGEQKMEKRIIIRSIVGSPAKIALIILLAILLIGGGYWWMLSENQAPDILHSLSSNTKNQTVIPTLAGNDTLDPTAQDSLESTAGSPNQKAGSAEQMHQSLSQMDRNSLNAKYQKAGAKDDSGALPPDVVSQSANVGFDDQGRRVVVSSEVVDALMQGKPEPADSADLQRVVRDVVPLARPQMVLNDEGMSGEDKNQSQTTQSESSSQVDTRSSQSSESLSIADMPEPAVEADPNGESRTKIRVRVARTSTDTPVVGSDRFSVPREALLNMSERSYTLQLAAFNSLAEVDDFIRNYDLQGKVNVYPTLRDGVEWFMITYRNYPTIQLARDAVSSLPANIQALGPWAKSMRQVHREIERAK